MDFYTTGAQVIPLIFVALAFEARTVWHLPSWYRFGYTRTEVGWIRGVLMIGTTFMLVVGETAALWALGNNVEVKFEAGYPAHIMAGALFVGGFSLFAHVTLQIIFESECLVDEPTNDSGRQRFLHKSLLAVFVLMPSVGLTWLAWDIVQALNN